MQPIVYNAILKEHIEKEIAKKDFIFNDSDYLILCEMLEEINENGYNFRYLAEVETYKIPNAYQIIKKHIVRFTSEATRAYLIPQLLEKLDKECGKFIFDMYIHFKESAEYISKSNEASPAHIHVRYDNAFKVLKPKYLKNELLELMYNPRDVYYLPFTAHMLASWKLPQMETILKSYLDSEKIDFESIGLCNDGKKYYPSLETIRKELLFLAISGLRYYPSRETKGLINSFLEHDDENVRIFAKKILSKINKAVE